jgi:hypothetical protein
MEWLGALNARYQLWKDAYQEAVSRDGAEAERLREEGYTFNGHWSTPEGATMFDGPGSYVSVLKHLEDVAKERDLLKDVEAIKNLLHPRRRKR